MTTFLIVLALFTALLLWYAVWGREWLKTKSWAAGFFAWIEPVEIALFKKSETILVARLKIVTGLLLSVLTSIGSIDLTPLMPFVPEAYSSIVHLVFNLLPMIVTVMGMMDEKLRNMTTKPIELVAIADKDVTPKVAEAVAMADATKVEALAAVEQAKAA